MSNQHQHYIRNHVSPGDNYVAGIASIRAAGVSIASNLSFLTGCSFTQAFIISHTTVNGASVLNAPAQQCVEETLYPAFLRADHTISRGGVSALILLAISCGVR